jgi:hypothetical protein
MAISGLLTLVAVNRPHKSNEFAGDNPVEIAILDLFVMFILSGVELIKLVPFLLESKL